MDSSRSSSDSDSGSTTACTAARLEAERPAAPAAHLAAFVAAINATRSGGYSCSANCLVSRADGGRSTHLLEQIDHFGDGALLPAADAGGEQSGALNGALGSVRLEEA